MVDVPSWPLKLTMQGTTNSNSEGQDELASSWQRRLLCLKTLWEEIPGLFFFLAQSAKSLSVDMCVSIAISRDQRWEDLL